MSIRISTFRSRVLPLLPAVFCFVAIGLSSHAARAIPVTGYDANNSRVPSPTYRSSTPVTYATPAGPVLIDSFFDIFTEIDRVSPPPVGGSQTNSFFDIFTEIDLQLPGAPAGLRESPSRPTVKFVDTSSGLPPGQRTFDTEMLQLDLAGGSLPPGVMIRESPTLQSTGKTSITDLGGGLFRVNSFFDVFTELSIDGGQTWTPGNAPMHLTGLPEPSTLTLAGLGLIAGAAMAIRRRTRRGR